VGASNHFVSAALAQGASSSRLLPPNDPRGHISQGQRVAEPKKGYPRPPGATEGIPRFRLAKTLRAKNNYSPIKLADLCGVGRSRSRPLLGNIGEVGRDVTGLTTRKCWCPVVLRSAGVTGPTCKASHFFIELAIIRCSVRFDAILISRGSRALAGEAD
jgi:hypothetical protein